jgi:hypothetical protein
MPEDLDTAVDLGIGWPANNLCRKMGEQMEGPTAEEDQKVGSHHADFGSRLMGPLSYDSVWSAESLQIRENTQAVSFITPEVQVGIQKYGRIVSITSHRKQHSLRLYKHAHCENMGKTQSY